MRLFRRPLASVVLAAALGWAASATAEPLVADLTSHLVAITTGFTGASVVLFGATDGPGDVVVVVRGPEREMTVRRKSKILGIWANTRSVTFANVPSFYELAASRPIEEVLAPDTAALYRIGFGNLKIQPLSPARPDLVPTFTAALIRTQQRNALFATALGKVSFLGDRLFRATIAFPANVPTGTYLIEVFLIRNREVVSGQTTPLVVSKVGVDAAVFDFASRQSVIYGLVAVLTAVVAGWLASVPFRGI
ncbi:MAG: TIGR02186 family protein [Alphaproteobacteria bacterium]|nr:TIGR02186 family protein [Alphaproteobacteria bacterium]